MSRGAAQRRQAWQRGRRGERLAAWWLRLKGYRILARDLRTPVGEIDIVARRGRTLALVEVKQRPSDHLALEAVSPRQQQRIVRAAQAFLGRHRNLQGLDLRFDTIIIVPARLPRHIADAWRPQAG